MFPKDDRGSRMLSEKTLNDLRAYWDHLRGRRQVPYRAELDPRRFEDALDSMFILEALGPENVRIRLAGTRLCEVMGMELRGMVPQGLIADADRSRFDYALKAVLSGPSVAEFRLQARDAAGTQAEAEMLLLPLRSDFGDVTRVLGCASGLAPLTKAPAEFSILQQRVEPLSLGGAVEPAERTGLPGFAEPQTAFDAGGEGAPRLRTIDGDRDDSAPAARNSRDHLSVVKGR